MVIGRVSGWRLSPTTSQLLRYNPHLKENQVCNCRRVALNERGIPIHEVAINPAVSLFAPGSEITIFSRISRWQEGPALAQFELNNILQVDLNIDDGSGTAKVNLFDHVETIHQDTFPIAPPFRQLVPHSGIRSIKEFQKEARTQTVGEAMDSSIRFILAGVHTPKAQQKDTFDFNNAAIRPLSELLMLIRSIAGIKPSKLEH